MIPYSLDTAPSGLSIHPSTGLITWLPALSQLGQQSVTVRGHTIFPDQRHQPQSATNHHLNAAHQCHRQQHLFATDPDPGEILIWSIVIAPAGASINAGSGQLLFTPTATGPINFNIRVTDLVGASSTQAFTVQVNAIANASPVFTSVAPTVADVNGLYAYQATATDPDNNPLFFSLVSGPSGMTV